MNSRDGGFGICQPVVGKVTAAPGAAGVSVSRGLSHDMRRALEAADAVWTSRKVF